MKYIPATFKRQLVLGYLASDGCVTGNSMEFVSVSLKLLNDMQDVLFSLGIISGVSKMNTYETKKIGSKTVNKTLDKYHLRIAKVGTVAIKSWNPNDIKLQRCKITSLFADHDLKKVWFSDDFKYIYFKVASINTEPYVGTVYNFECATHTFMCNYIPTHNCDPVDQDQSNTMSLACVLVMDLWTDKIIAEYTGRPPFADDFYQIVWLLCKFYNAKCLYESNIKGLFTYFSVRNSTWMLADTPEYLKDKQIVKSGGFGNTAKGVRATVPVINYAFRCIRDWLLKPAVIIETDSEGNEVEATIPNLYNIRNRALLKELILWNPFGNYDRIMSLAQLMLYREEKIILYQGDMKNQSQGSSGLEADDYWDKNYPGKDKGLRFTV